MHFLKVFFLFLCSCASCDIVVAQVKAKPGAIPVFYDANGEPVYKLIDLENQHPDTGLTPLVYQGTKSVEGEFPEVGFLGFCTATAVGPKVIYTAAHCVSNGQKVNWKRRKDGVSYSAVCNIHPQYNDRTVFNDYAFCILDSTLPEGTVFASFNTEGSPASGAEALVNGFGAPNLGTHYWGKAVVRSMDGQDIVTCGPANLGGGDSGGAFFKWSIDRNDPRKHIIDGTNSRAGGGCSYFNTTSHPNFKPYALTVAEKAGSYICGVNKDCLAPPIDPNKCPDEQKFVTYVGTELKRANDTLALCRAQ